MQCVLGIYVIHQYENTITMNRTRTEVANMRKFSSANRRTREQFVSRFDVFDAIDCFRDGVSCNARTSSNFIARCIRWRVDRSRINEWYEKKFRKGRENVGKMASAKRISNGNTFSVPYIIVCTDVYARRSSNSILPRRILVVDY